MSGNTISSTWRVTPAASTAGASGGGGGLPARATAVITTAALADQAVEEGHGALPGKTAALVTVAVDRACRVRLYASDTAQTADLARALGTLPTPGEGVLAEFHFTGADSLTCSPVAILTNTEGAPTARVWYTAQNLSGAAHTVGVTLGILAMES
jgi:hypothetical protein